MNAHVNNIEQHTPCGARSERAWQGTWLLDRRGERLPFLAEHEDEHFGGSGGTRVFRIMHDLGRVMERFTRLDGLRRLPLGLQGEGAVEDVGKLWSRVEMFARRCPRC